MVAPMVYLLIHIFNMSAEYHFCVYQKIIDISFCVSHFNVSIWITLMMLNVYTVILCWNNAKHILNYITMLVLVLLEIMLRKAFLSHNINSVQLHFNCPLCVKQIHQATSWWAHSKYAHNVPTSDMRNILELT